MPPTVESVQDLNFRMCIQTKIKLCSLIKNHVSLFSKRFNRFSALKNDFESQNYGIFGGFVDDYGT